MSAKIRILIADDHLVVRIGLVSILRRERGFEIVGESGNGLEAINLAEKLKPDVIIMDMMMPKADGCTATIEILKKQPDAKILVLTTFGASTEVKRALEAGAIGAIVKDESHEHLILAIRDAAEGKRYVSPEISRALESSAILPRISDRQKEILQMIAKGFDYPEISRLLGITTDGVKSHMRIVFENLLRPRDQRRSPSLFKIALSIHSRQISEGSAISNTLHADTVTIPAPPAAHFTRRPRQTRLAVTSRARASASRRGSPCHEGSSRGQSLQVSAQSISQITMFGQVSMWNMADSLPNKKVSRGLSPFVCEMPARSTHSPSGQ